MTIEKPAALWMAHNILGLDTYEEELYWPKANHTLTNVEYRQLKEHYGTLYNQAPAALQVL